MTGKTNSNLTSTQGAAWQVYKRLRKKLGRAPTVREYQAALELKSPRGAQHYIDVFRARRLITPITESKLTLKGQKAK